MDDKNNGEKKQGVEQQDQRDWTVAIGDTGAPCVACCKEFNMLSDHAVRLGIKPANCCSYCWGCGFMRQRKIIREKYNIAGTDCGDFNTYGNCFPCAIHQMEQELVAMGI